MAILPAQGFLLIEILENDSTTKEGIYMPGAPGDEPMQGKVLAVGQQRMSEYGEVMPYPATPNGTEVTDGNMVMFKKHTVNTLPDRDEVKRGFIPFEVVMGIDTGTGKEE